VFEILLIRIQVLVTFRQVVGLWLRPDFQAPMRDPLLLNVTFHLPSSIVDRRSTQKESEWKRGYPLDWGVYREPENSPQSSVIQYEKRCVAILCKETLTTKTLFRKSQIFPFTHICFQPLLLPNTGCSQWI